jgi:hypothetical protein
MMGGSEGVAYRAAKRYLPNMAKSMMDGSTKGVISGADKIQKAVHGQGLKQIDGGSGKAVGLLEKIQKAKTPRAKKVKEVKIPIDATPAEAAKLLAKKSKYTPTKEADLRELLKAERANLSVDPKLAGPKLTGPKLEFGAGSGAALSDLQRNTAKTHATKMQSDERYRKAFNAAMKKEAEK